jgi:hypothetical protein
MHWTVLYLMYMYRTWLLSASFSESIGCMTQIGTYSICCPPRLPLHNWRARLGARLDGFRARVQTERGRWYQREEEVGRYVHTHTRCLHVCYCTFSTTRPRLSSKSAGCMADRPMSLRLDASHPVVMLREVCMLCVRGTRRQALVDR